MYVLKFILRIFILRNYFHYQVFDTNYIFGIFMRMKLNELWERCFNTICFKFKVLEVRFCAGRPHVNPTSFEELCLIT